MVNDQERMRGSTKIRDEKEEEEGREKGETRGGTSKSLPSTTAEQDNDV